MPTLTRFATLETLKEVALEIITLLPRGVVVLQGDLASGKTTLVKAIASALGIAQTVTSPTFSLQQNYEDRLFHYDIYNKGIEHFMALGLLDALEDEGLHCIEWGDATLIALLQASQIPFIIVTIEKQSHNRCYRIEHA